jgi:PAS domain S-box-containing protein
MRVVRSGGRSECAKARSEEEDREVLHRDVNAARQEEGNGSRGADGVGHEASLRSGPARAWPLRWLLSLFALALIVPLLGFGMFAASRMIARERAAEEEDVRRTARMVSADVDRLLRGLIETLQALAGSNALREGDLAAFHREASALMRGAGHVILLVDPDLNELINTRVPYGTPLPQIGDPNTVRKVLATGKPEVGDLNWGPVAQQFRAGVMAPVRVDGAVRYVAVLSIDPAILRQALEQQNLPDGWVARVSDPKGLILARSERHQELYGQKIPPDSTGETTGRSGVIRTRDREGKPILLSDVWSDLSGWRTAVWVPLTIVEAPSRQLWQALAIVAALAFTVSLIAAVWLGRWLARPIAATASAAAALGRGDPVGYAPSAIAEMNVVGATLAAAAEQRRQAEAEAAQLAAIVQSSDDAIIGMTLEGRITSWNTGAESIFGYTASEMIGQPIFRIIPPELHGEEEEILSRLRRGERIEHYETNRVTKGGRRMDISLTVSPVLDKAGRVIGVSKVSRDITERKRAEEHVRLLMRELSHRTKNLMAVVQAISFQTMRKSDNLKDFEQRFTQRLTALARSQDLLLKRDWQGVVLDDLVRAQLEPFLDSAKQRLAAHGPPLLLMPLAAQDLGMALHELATNASKYGALSVPTGKIEIGWTVDGGTADGKRFRMSWRESGGPMVNPPARTGFGSTVTTRTLTGTFNGKAELEYRPEGLSWHLTAPMGDLIAEL